MTRPAQKRISYPEHEVTVSLRDAAYDRLRTKLLLLQSDRDERDRQRRRYLLIAAFYVLSCALMLWGLFG